CSRQDSNYDSW
nr:immunoglobulin heavy chain junction region [Macaca mulatta]